MAVILNLARAAPYVHCFLRNLAKLVAKSLFSITFTFFNPRASLLPFYGSNRIIVSLSWSAGLANGVHT